MVSNFKYWKMKTILFIEPFYGGSHKQLADLLSGEFGDFVELYTLSAKKWHWRARTSALHFSEEIPRSHNFHVLFASSVLNLAELIALRPDIGQLHKILYFHENQLLYPVCKQQERDFQYGYNQILSCLVADKVVFNSKFNQESFLNSLSSYFSIMPKPRPKELEAKIRPKCIVLYYPLVPTIKSYVRSAGEIMSQNLAENKIDKEKNNSLEQCRAISFQDQNTVDIDNSIQEDQEVCSRNNKNPLHILWPHRWEHDKNPEMFFSILYQLQKESVPFEVSVLGESFQEIPDVFIQAKDALKEHIVHWGYQESRDHYLNVLLSADVVISTAEQEFFGVAMLEAVMHGCYPLCPKRLVYPEIYPEEFLYNTPNQLFKMLKRYCKHPGLVRNQKFELIKKIEVQKFEWDSLKPMYGKLLKINVQNDVT